MIVYRVEHGSVVDDRTHHGRGPMAEPDRFGRWRDRVFIAQITAIAALNDRDDKPTPFRDEKLRGISGDELCGANSMESLRFWFEESLDDLEWAGFVVRKYDVPDWACRVGRSGQVLFEHRYAKLVSDEEKAHE